MDNVVPFLTEEEIRTRRNSLESQQIEALGLALGHSVRIADELMVLTQVLRHLAEAAHSNDSSIVSQEQVSVPANAGSA